MNLRETTQVDIDFVAEHSVSHGCFKDQPEKIDYMYTLEHEGKVLGIGGLKLINKTTAWAWVDITDEAQQYMIIGYRVIKEWMAKLVELGEIRRLQAYIETDFPEAIRMAEHLGFKKESTMRNFVGDKPAHLFVRIL